MGNAWVNYYFPLFVPKDIFIDIIYNKSKKKLQPTFLKYCLLN
jgi:hypothetical protein